MTQEEKAKAYDEAINKAGEHYNEDYTSTLERSILAYVFPELKESEDEKIRKELWAHFHDLQLRGYSDFSPSFTIDDILAYLEKQGEQKPFDYENANIQQKDFAPKGEPKFKVGDWIVASYGKVNQVVSVDKDSDGYTLDDGMYFSGSWCNKYHLWTIQDAKDGDVLDFDCGVGIFKNLSTDRYNAHCYCYYDTNSQLETNDCGLYDIYEAKPATKEQRDLLFQKMHEAGYEWNAEKKELKKIESKPFLKTTYK